jgi:lipopolysaccharide/colanic/teichoic acid biosynthesis glycosyltransferase
LKRGFDLIVGGTLALVAIPVIALLALIGTFVWHANPFFVQERVGLHGRRFRVWKLRSLPVNAPAYADKYALEAVPIPTYGQWLRRLHLDELPQVFLVVTQKMSLVGPRPEMAFLHEQMPREFAEQRVSVRPGVTGLWQVSPALSGLILEAPEYDTAYLSAPRLRLDVWILYRTALKVVGAQPVPLSEVPTWALSRGSIARSYEAHRAEVPVPQAAA